MIKFDILVHPSFPQPKVKAPETGSVPTKRWKFPWRINMLAVPKPPVASKYVPAPPDTFKVYGPLDPATEFRSDHLARPFVRKLVENKGMYRHDDPNYAKKMTKIILKSWGSIYNYYKKILRERRLKRLKVKQTKLNAKKPKGKELEKIESMRIDRLKRLAHAKKLFLPDKIPRKHKAIEDLMPGIDHLATPKERRMLPPREIGVVNAAALLYEITDIVLKLSQPLERRKERSPNLDEFFGVKRSALFSKCTPRTEKLATPSLSAREAKKHDEDKYDPWAISRTALKYKPTPRILELAKPLERE